MRESESGPFPLPDSNLDSSIIWRESSLSCAVDVSGGDKNLGAPKREEVMGKIASATTSREGALGRRIEIPISGARELLDLECENHEIFGIFRGFTVGDWVEINGVVRRRFWRSGTTIGSRSYIQVSGLKAR